ncbi:CAMK family protein kinase [Tritrichomonas foetus]|uniref:CAMK family protein kinase n=1 Tax=Tritrichomonas foetus TaxID=1144522 RepID=A0A1J4L4C9_9EUKA|nr:CAMK family protein kinase [Tritrichomonas foetus]|eukprot:OHT16798.1 CAMK family protein kinase [Tritrichomonas foetus]
MQRSMIFEAHGYKEIRDIGSGACSTVYLVESIKYRKQFALKIIDSKKCNLPVEHEIDSLIGLNHPYIIKMYEFFHVDEFLCIVLQYCPRGSLQDELDEKGPLNKNDAIVIMRNVIEALNHCHMKQIAHHDIKPGNIFVDEYGRAVLADFGLSASIDPGKLSQRFVGSRVFMAPEQIRFQMYDPMKADIWALGVTFYMLLTGDVPWKLTSLRDLDNSIIS